MERFESDAIESSNSMSPSTTENKNCVYTFSDNADSDNENLKYKSKNNTHPKSPLETYEEKPLNMISPGESDRTKTTTDDDGYDDDDDDDNDEEEEEENDDNKEHDKIDSVNSETNKNRQLRDEDESSADNSSLQQALPSTSPQAQSIHQQASPPIMKSVQLEEPSETAASLTATTTATMEPVRVKRLHNGNIPKSGKPMAFAIEKLDKMDKKSNKIRGRPKRKALVAMYQSQISDNQIGIKLKLKKSLFEMTPGVSESNKKPTRSSNRKKSRRARKSSDSEDEDSDSRKRRRRERVNNNTVRSKKDEELLHDDLSQQSDWARRLPDEILYKIFEMVVKMDGCLPTMVRLGKVCSSWHRVSLTPPLWNNVDLAAWTKEKYRTELNLKWLIQNRLSACEEVNFSNYKVTDIQCVLEILLMNSSRLTGITLSGWKGFSSEHLTFLVNNFKLLQRLDLSSINMDMHPNKSSVDLQSFCNAMKSMSERLTHLYMAHNRLVGVPQIVNALSTHCPNLVLLDLSNVTTAAISHAVLHIERLQHGCQKLKVLRITNSHILLSTATLQEMMDSPGFPELEELSIASLAAVSRLTSDEYLQRILKTSTKLQLLDVRGCARLTYDSLIRLPTWDLKHLFLSGCSITRDVGSGLELIASKWAHSLIECDLAWANVQTPLDNAILALAEKGRESPLTHLNLCGSSVSLEAVKEILSNCPHLNSINLSSCRGLPRGVKRLLQGTNEIEELRENLNVTLKFPVNKITPPSSSQSPQKPSISDDK